MTSLTGDALRVVACVIRKDTSVDLGITFSQDVVNGCLIIDSLAPNGLFANTGLALDQQVVKFNGHSCSRSSKQKLDKTETLIHQAKGIITLEAQSPGLAAAYASNDAVITENQIFSIQKPIKTFQLRVEFEKIEAPEDQLRIVQVAPTFQKILGLKQGLQLLGINGTACNIDDVESVRKQMNDAFPILSLQCVDTVMNRNIETTSPKKALEKEANENVRVVACIHRPESFLDLGMTFRRDEESGSLIIDSVSKSGFFAQTGLKPGQKIVKINGHRRESRMGAMLSSSYMVL